MEVNRAILQSIFEKEYNLLEAENGEQAMVLVEQYHYQIAAVLLDIVMPIKDGYQVLGEIGSKGYLSEFPVVIITAESSAESEVRAFDMGASDMIVKPFEPHVVKRRVQNNIELNLHRQNQDELIEEQASKLRESNSAMIDALSSIIEYRSVETGQHIRRIRMFTKVLLENVSLNYSEFMLDERKINIIVSASSMHDIGKIAIPDSILNKPGRLTKEEFDIMKTHSVKGCEMISSLSRMTDKEYLQYAYNICRYHHERWDGKGYPDRLKGDSIPICAQVVGIADCYDALTTDRVYKKAIAPDRAMDMIQQGECGVFAPKLLECLKNVRTVFARFAREYSDNPVAHTEMPAQPLKAEAERADGTMVDTLRLGQLKYFTLLKYMRDTVMEVDLITGVYHLAYTSGNDFEALRSGKTFSESIRNFAEAAVHPKDRHQVLELLDEYMRQFFREGMMKRCRRYRIYNRSLKEYRWCQATLLRIDVDNPYQRKILLVWHEDKGYSEERTLSADDGRLLQSLFGGIQILRNDRWFTLTSLCEYLQHLLGYSQREMKERFMNKYINLIRPADRKEIFQQMQEQLRNGSLVELEYPIVAKNGTIIWLLDKRQLVIKDDGEEYFYCILIDITKSKQAQEELRRLIERHRLIMEQTNDIIFEWDIEGDRVMYSSSGERRLGHPLMNEQARSSMDDGMNIYSEDQPNLAKLLNTLKDGKAYGETDLRMMDSQGQYRWYKIRAAAQFDTYGKAYKVIGVATDVDEEKQKLMILRNQAERDGLTMLYNRSTAKKDIESYLRLRQPDSRAAMIIVDVDDFKHINDTYGHMSGDLVLQKVAIGLHRLFRSNDIIARIGGDEFLLFMKDIPSRAIAENRAEKVLDIFRNITWNDNVQYKVTCSLGIAFCPDDGISFDTLFSHSDRALYHAKAKGKEGFRVFDKTMMEDDILMPQVPAANTVIDSEISQSELQATLIEDVFRCLYESANVGTAMNTILEMTGRCFSLSRVYVFEDSHDGRRAGNIFEWCNQGITPRKEQQSFMDYTAQDGDYHQSFDEAGMFYCPDPSALPEWQQKLLAPYHIKSMLQYAIREDGVFRGFVGFDDCAVSRFWSKEQIDVLAFIAKLAAVFFLKKWDYTRMRHVLGDFTNLLDHQSELLYVIRVKDHKILYMNKRLRSCVPKASVGKLCHHLLFRQQEPCEGCLTGSEDYRRMYSPVLEAWLEVGSHMIEWNGEQACMVECHLEDKKKEN